MFTVLIAGPGKPLDFLLIVADLLPARGRWKQKQEGNNVSIQTLLLFFLCNWVKTLLFPDVVAVLLLCCCFMEITGQDGGQIQTEMTLLFLMLLLLLFVLLSLLLGNNSDGRRADTNLRDTELTRTSLLTQCSVLTLFYSWSHRTCLEHHSSHNVLFSSHLVLHLELRDTLPLCLRLLIFNPLNPAVIHLNSVSQSRLYQFPLSPLYFLFYFHQTIFSSSCPDIDDDDL